MPHEDISLHVLVTGITGYVGGTAFVLLISTYESFKFSAVIRTPEQAEALQLAHPSVTPVLISASSDPDTILKDAAKASDIVVDIAGDNDEMIASLLAGLASKPSKGTFIHVSGITSLIDPQNLNLGKAATKIYSDVDDMTTILAFTPERQHVTCEQFIINKGEKTDVKTVILSSCQILGNGTGPFKKESFGHGYAKIVAGREKGFVIDEGANIWSWVSVIALLPQDSSVIIL